MNTHLIYGILLGLTGSAVWAANARLGALVLIGLGCLKLLVIAHHFMDLKDAHLFWKTAPILFVGLFMAVSFFVL